MLHGKFIQKLDITNQKNILSASYAYGGRKIKRNISRAPKGAVTAVVIHLYYPEIWPYFTKKLALLREGSFKVFVSISKNDAAVREMILDSFSDATIFITPNRGRDVLPFIKIAKHLRAAGYKNVLKIHSKKSTHRIDGDDWLSQLMNGLIPENSKMTAHIERALEKSDTGILGPLSQYISLPVNFDANSSHIQSIVGKLLGKDASDRVDKKRYDYGFFAGTMFWARLDAIDPILQLSYPISSFDKELGQIDGTLAHGLERVFTLYPELQGKKIYGIENTSIVELKYKTDQIPDWSNVLRE